MKTIRLARPGDVDALLAIYAPYLSTTVTFEYVVPSREEFARRIADVQARFPYLVLEEDGQPIGYAYAHLLAERFAEQWCAERASSLSPAACRGCAPSMAVSPTPTPPARPSTPPWISVCWAPSTTPAIKTASGWTWPGMKSPYPTTPTPRPSPSPWTTYLRRRWRTCWRSIRRC